MKTLTKKTTKVVVALAAAIITIIIILFAWQPAHTAGDSENVGATLVTTVVTTTEENSFLEATTASTSTTSTTVPTTTEITTTTHTTTSPIVTEVETIQTIQTTYETTEIIEIVPETTTEIIEIVPETTTTPVVTETYVVYKPATHYIHMNTCRLAEGDIYTIENTEGIEARRCSECNPTMEIITTYITEYERILLCNVVAREYGSDYVPTAEKAKVVAVVMNRVRDSRFPDNIHGVLTQPKQFSGYVAYNTYTRNVTTDVIAAVDYYFNHTSEFSTSILYFWGDGRWNHFW